VLYGRYNLLDELTAYKVRPTPQAYEFELSRTLLDVLDETPGVTIYGITDQRRLEERVPTVSFTLKGWRSRRVAEELDKANIYVWDGNYYALAVTERLGLEESGGMVRVGPVHYSLKIIFNICHSFRNTILYRR
jgi:selenocysteine lyase/cysteine desulfurase